MKKTGLALVMLLFIMFGELCYAGPGPLKLAVYWTSPVLNIEVIGDLAKNDLVIIDLENWINNPASIKALKEKNPNIKILTYANPMELFYKRMDKRSIGWQLFNKMKEPPYDKWWLMSTKKQHVIFYTPLPMWMMNLSTDCPVIDGERWNTFYAKYLVENILKKEPRPDGFFGDNPTCHIAWMNHEKLKPEKDGVIDSRQDGRPDKDDDLDSKWCDGQKEFYSIITKEMGKDFLIITNKGELDLMEPVKLVDGIMFEEFPNNYLGDKTAGGWYQSMDNYLKAGYNSIVHTVWPAGKDHFRYVLASSLLGDGYFMVGHNCRNWFPEYDEFAKLGKAVTSVTKYADYWHRGFENGILVVWPKTRQVELIFFKK